MRHQVYRWTWRQRWSMCTGELDANTVAVVVDVSEGVFRLGYGVADALATLKEKESPFVMPKDCA